MSLINFEINLTVTWSVNLFGVAGTINDQVPTFAITDAKHCVPVVTLSAQDNTKLLQQLNSRFKRTVNWNK